MSSRLDNDKSLARLHSPAAHPNIIRQLAERNNEFIYDVALSRSSDHVFALISTSLTSCGSLMGIPEADDTSTKSSNRLPFAGQAPTFERVYAFRWIHLLSPSAVGAFAFDIRIVALGPVSMTLGFRFPPRKRSVVFRNHVSQPFVRQISICCSRRTNAFPVCSRSS